MKNNIPTHDPQTGELNMLYEELTGQPNPLINLKKDNVMIEKTSDMIISNVLDHITKEIQNNNKLTDVSNDPSFYLGKIHALQDIQSKILKLLIKK
jgi:hypothetical protein